MKQPDFKSPSVFADLEDQAMGGQLNYDSFPPCEYKYFSRLAKLGYQNRHKNLSAEICKAKQAEHRKEYHIDCDRRDFFARVAKLMQDNIRAGEMKVDEARKAETVTDMINAVCDAVGLMIGDDTFAGFIKRRLEEADT